MGRDRLFDNTFWELVRNVVVISLIIYVGHSFIWKSLSFYCFIMYVDFVRIAYIGRHRVHLCN